jgi:hypothetical protein
MRFATKIMVALAVVPAALQAPGDSGLGATNCGFLTIEQCRATLTGGASFCVPNQFYNPGGPAKRTRSQQEGREVRARCCPKDFPPGLIFQNTVETIDFIGGQGLEPWTR